MRIGIKSGTWRLLTPGHIWALNYCKEKCDWLIVLTNSDEYLIRNKGSCPIDLAGRLNILGSLKMVDGVAWFAEDTEDQWIEKFYYTSPLFQPGEDKLIVFHSIEIKGKEHIPGERYADEIWYVPRIPGSTTEIIKKIKGE